MKASGLEAWANCLERLGACDESRVWLAKQLDVETAWRKCRRGDWMLWLLARVAKHGPDVHRLVVLAAYDCAQVAASGADGETQTVVALCPEVPRDWAKHGVSDIGDVFIAARVAYAAAAVAAAVVVRRGSLAKSANIVRKYFPCAPRLEDVR